MLQYRNKAHLFLLIPTSIFSNFFFTITVFWGRRLNIKVWKCILASGLTQKIKRLTEKSEFQCILPSIFATKILSYAYKIIITEKVKIKNTWKHFPWYSAPHPSTNCIFYAFKKYLNCFLPVMWSMHLW